MKKLLPVAIAACSLLCGCGEPEHTVEAEIGDPCLSRYEVYVVEFSAHGEKHEYLKITSTRHCGLAHLPNCRYCHSKTRFSSPDCPLPPPPDPKRH